jgi:hypothetical protein
MSRPQFTLRTLLVLLLAVGCFFGGIRFERERQRREDEVAKKASWLGKVYPMDGAHGALYGLMEAQPS